MSKHIRQLYIVTAIIWGAILGTLSFQIIGGGVAGTFWIFIFGDNVWPNWAWIIVYTVAGIAGLGFFCACVFMGWSYSRKFSEKGADTKNDYLTVIFLLVLSVIVISGYFALDRYQEKKTALLHQKRLEAENKRKENSSPNRKASESDVDYYCRVIRKGSKIELFYQGHRIKIISEILLGKRLLFAVAAPYDLVNEIAREIVFREDVVEGSKKPITEFIPLPANVSCGNNIYFISSVENNLPPSLFGAKKIHGDIPSIHVGFTFNVRH